MALGHQAGVREPTRALSSNRKDRSHRAEGPAKSRPHPSEDEIEAGPVVTQHANGNRQATTVARNQHPGPPAQKAGHRSSRRAHKPKSHRWGPSSTTGTIMEYRFQQTAWCMNPISKTKGRTTGDSRSRYPSSHHGHPKNSSRGPNRSNCHGGNRPASQTGPCRSSSKHWRRASKKRIVTGTARSQ